MKEGVWKEVWIRRDVIKKYIDEKYHGSDELDNLIVIINRL